MVSTGNTYNWRDPDYFNEIKSFIKLHSLKNYRILGAIEHKDLLSLAHHSSGIINPSFSEGWSNSVELAKALNKINLLSDIKCHKEQSDRNSFFFKTKDYKKLAKLLIMKKNSKKKRFQF